jgi:hypothetical protein
MTLVVIIIIDLNACFKANSKQQDIVEIICLSNMVYTKPRISNLIVMFMSGCKHIEVDQKGALVY